MREGSWLIQIRMGGSRGGKSRTVGRVGLTGIRIRNDENGKETRWFKKQREVMQKLLPGRTGKPVAVTFL